VRCHLASRVLAKVLKDFPDISVEKIEFLTNMGRAREAGVKSFPYLVSGDKKFTSIVMTEKGIRGFFKSL